MAGGGGAVGGGDEGGNHHGELLEIQVGKDRAKEGRLVQFLRRRRTGSGRGGGGGSTDWILPENSLDGRRRSAWWVAGSGSQNGSELDGMMGGRNSTATVSPTAAAPAWDGSGGGIGMARWRGKPAGDGEERWRSWRLGDEQFRRCFEDRNRLSERQRAVVSLTAAAPAWDGSDEVAAGGG